MDTQEKDCDTVQNSTLGNVREVPESASTGYISNGAPYNGEPYRHRPTHAETTITALNIASRICRGKPDEYLRVYRGLKAILVDAQQRDDEEWEAKYGYTVS